MCGHRVVWVACMGQDYRACWQFAMKMFTIVYINFIWLDQGLIEPPKAARGHVTAWLAKCKVLLNLAHRSSTT